MTESPRRQRFVAVMKHFKMIQALLQCAQAREDCPMNGRCGACLPDDRPHSGEGLDSIIRCLPWA